MNKHWFLNYSAHQGLWALALPMLLSNITVPLLGLIDTAIIGHLPHAYYLGGVALGATLMSLLVWLFGFLRMATTGMIAQGFGAGDNTRQIRTLLQGSSLALLLSVILMLISPWLFELCLAITNASAEVKHYALIYVDIRIWSLPFALLNMVFLGYLLGRQQPKVAMWQVIVANLANIIFDLWFVLGLELGVQGAAYASVIADVVAFLIAFYMVRQQLDLSALKQQLVEFKLSDCLPLFRLKRDIFIRSLCLQLTFSFMTFQGANLGDNTVAANAVLMNLLMLISYLLDSIAYYAEAQGGKYWGENNRQAFADSVRFAWGYTWLTGFIFSIGFYLCGELFIAQLTNILEVQQLAMAYLPYLIAMPILACSAYLLDGVYIATAMGQIMRNSMLICTFAIFFPIWLLCDYGLELEGNRALWIALCSFMAARSLTLAWHYQTRLATNKFQID